MTREEDTMKYIERVHATGRAPNIVQLDSWETPASAYSRYDKFGRASIKKRRYHGTYMSYGSRGTDFVHFNKRCEITALQIDGKTWMVDDPWHWWNIQDTAELMHGDVLVGGLGLGLIIHALNANENVRSITLVERETDVIGLIAPFLKLGKTTIVRGDVHEVIKEKHRHFDGAFIDLWVTHGLDETRNVLFKEVIPLAATIRSRFSCPMYALGFTGTDPVLALD